MEIQFFAKVKFRSGNTAYLCCSENQPYWVENIAKATKLSYEVARTFCFLYSKLNNYTDDEEMQFFIFAQHEEAVNWPG